jgi:hypothetical protein
LNGEVKVNAPIEILRQNPVAFNVALGPGTPLAAEEGTILYVVKAAFIDDVKIQTKIFQAIVFREPEVAKAKEIVSTLTHYASVVDGVVDSFRLGGFVT